MRGGGGVGVSESEGWGGGGGWNSADNKLIFFYLYRKVGSDISYKLRDSLHDVS